MLVISLSAPRRVTNATSSRPEDINVLRKPTAMDMTPTNTTVTPAMPIAVVRAEPLRRK
jgi:hypothetical protein